jgi:hypothetical protein
MAALRTRPIATPISAPGAPSLNAAFGVVEGVDPPLVLNDVLCETADVLEPELVSDEIWPAEVDDGIEEDGKVRLARALADVASAQNCCARPSADMRSPEHCPETQV